MIIPKNILLNLTEENWAAADADKDFEKQKGQAIEHSIIEITGGGSPFKYSHWDMRWSIDGVTTFCEVKSTTTSWTKISAPEIKHAKDEWEKGIDTILLSFVQMNPRDQFKFVGSTLYSKVKDLLKLSDFLTDTGDRLYIISNSLIRQNHIDIDLPTGQPTPTFVL